MRFDRLASAALGGAALMAVGALASVTGCAEPRAIAAAVAPRTSAAQSSREPRSDVAQDSIGQVRLGSGLDIQGKVPRCLGVTRFAEGQQIYFSLWEMSVAPAGSVLRVTVLDAADRVVWTEDQAAPYGGTYLTFDFGRALARGRYRADVKVGAQLMSRTGFEVFERAAR